MKCAWFVLPLTLVLAACGSRRAADVPLTPLPVGTYSFSGSVQGTNFDGLVTLTADNLAVSGNMGACPDRPAPRTQGATRSIQRTRRLEVVCAGLRLQLRWDAHGEVVPIARVSIPVTREELVRGDCIRWARNERGAQSCVEYARVVRQFRTQAETTASVRRIG